MNPIGTEPHTPITELLHQMRTGDASARDELIGVVYQTLHRIAESQLRKERPDHTLQPTALVNEAYLKLFGHSEIEFADRTHFFALVSRAMRRILGAPASLEHARGFYHATNPGEFFRVIVPITQLFLLLALVFNWKPAPGTRWKLAGALVFLILTDIITFRFHYPRNDILFVAPLTNPPAYYDRVVKEWAMGNYVRVALILTVVVLVMASMIRIARDTAPGKPGSLRVRSADRTADIQT
jgi:ECF sigma factor/Anthrone oxygenase